MSNVVNIESPEQFLEFIDQDKTVILFTATSWCGPCKALEPRYAVASTQTEIPFATVDIDVQPQLAEEYLIMSVPTMVLFEKGNVVRGIGGRTAPAILKEL